MRMIKYKVVFVQPLKSGIDVIFEAPYNASWLELVQIFRWKTRNIKVLHDKPISHFQFVFDDQTGAGIAGTQSSAGKFD